MTNQREKRCQVKKIIHKDKKVSKSIFDTLNVISMLWTLATRTSFFCAALPHGPKMIEEAAYQPLLKACKTGSALLVFKIKGLPHFSWHPANYF